MIQPYIGPAALLNSFFTISQKQLKPIFVHKSFALWILKKKNSRRIIDETNEVWITCVCHEGYLKCRIDKKKQ